jgi:SAM-dependent methyltransferase
MRRAATLVLAAVAAGHLVDALVLRRRYRAIPVLPEARARTTGTDGTIGPVGVGGTEIVAAPGAMLDEPTKAAVDAELDAAGLDALDLVPGDLPAERLLRLLRRVDPTRLESDPLYSPGGAHEALAVRTALADRLAGREPSGPEEGTGTGPAGGVRRLDRLALVRHTVRAQRYAPARTGLRRAPGLRAGYYGADHHWAELAAATRFQWPPGSTAVTLLRSEAAQLALLAAGAVAVPPAGLSALAAWSAKPAVALGAPAAPAAVTRWPTVVADTLRTLVVGRRAVAAEWARHASSFRDPDDTPTSHVRVTERRSPSPGTSGAGARAGDDGLALVPRPAADELFEERRTACPWCGAGDLVERVSTPDLLQHKPGTFRLDECRGCGHVFQNPPLSIAGLDYHYDQFYEGIAEEGWERVSVAMAPQFRARVDAVARVVERAPRAWLDVGTGPGHFCVVARQRWPYTTFDGLDMGDTVEEAEARGWVQHGHRGMFPDLADKLTGAYDVVSMHHYLEHTRDPRRELAAAATALAPGGLLVVEVPDPQSPWGRRLGRYWLCWFQPQHQHFVSCANLTAALDEAGLGVVSVERAPATMGWDLAGAVMLFFGHHLPKAPAPWLPRPTAGQRAGRWLGGAVAVPALVAAAAADVVKDAWYRRPGNTRPGNAYRVIAKRTGGGGS